MLELPPTFDLSLKQMTTASLTARMASKQPQLLPLWFGGSSAFNNGIRRPSMGGAHLAQRAAALLSNDAAFKFLSRCCLVARYHWLLTQASEISTSTADVCTYPAVCGVVVLLYKNAVFISVSVNSRSLQALCSSRTQPWGRGG